MFAVLLNLCFFGFMVNMECVSLCEAKLSTVNMGCHLEWKCFDDNPKTTFTVQTKTRRTTWQQVSGCVQISAHRCDLSEVIENPHIYNFIKLSSEEPDWTMNDSLLCDPMNDKDAKFSPPSISITMENGNLWVKGDLPCAPSKYCHDISMCCLSATVIITLYNKHKPSDTQTRNATLVEYNEGFEEEFGFLTPGQEYCAVATHFTHTLPHSSQFTSPTSLPQCVYLPKNTETLIILIVLFGVVIAVGVVLCLLCRQYTTREPPLPKSLALLEEFQFQTFIYSSKAAPDIESLEGDKISIVSHSELILMDKESYCQNSQSLGGGYYTGPVLHNPSGEESAEDLSVESEDLETDGKSSPIPTFGFLGTSHPVVEAGGGFPDPQQSEVIPSIPLSSVRVKEHIWAFHT